MKISVTSTTLALALAASVVAAPTATHETGLSKRENEIISQLNEIAVIKRENNLSEEQVIELAQRDYPIITEILRLLNTDSFAAKFIQKLVDDPNLQPIITSTVEWLIKNNVINLTTLFNALDDSGLAATVIKDIINDCNYYSQIYNLVLNEITGGGSSASSTPSSSPAQKRDVFSAELMRRDDSSSQDTSSDSFINQLLNSLAESGLASDLVKRLLVDPQFLKYGVSLIEDLFSSGSLTIGDVIDALTQSTLIPDLFKEFFTVDTLKTVITNALAAASGKCDTAATSLNFDPTTRTRTGSATGTATTGTGTGTATRTTAGSTSTSTKTCRKKRKRSYN